MGWRDVVLVEEKKNAPRDREEGKGIWWRPLRAEEGGGGVGRSKAFVRCFADKLPCRIELLWGQGNKRGEREEPNGMRVGESEV